MTDNQDPKSPPIQVDDGFPLDLTDLDPSLEELDHIRQRATEIEAVHQAMEHGDESVLFTYRRVVYDDESQEVVVCCQCGWTEVAGYGEPDPDEPYIMLFFPARPDDPN